MNAVESGIIFGIFGTMILAGARAIGISFGDLSDAIEKFLGLISIFRPKVTNFGQPP